jgi:mannose-6-phosphate isomerase class I
MVLRMTGASWLAIMMRAERDETDRPGAEPAWLLLDSAPDPEMIEALERLVANDAR